MSRRYRLSLLMGCPAGGVSCTGTCSPCRCGALWGACLLCRPPALPPRCLVGWRGCFGRLPTPPLVYFPAPLPRRGRISPLPPFPSGEGGDFLFSYARGSAPCIPGIRPPAALTEPAKQVPSGGVPPAALAIPAPGERTISNAEVPLPRSPLSLAGGTAHRCRVLTATPCRVSERHLNPASQETKPPAGYRDGNFSQCRAGSAPGMQGAEPLA